MIIDVLQDVRDSFRDKVENFKGGSTSSPAMNAEGMDEESFFAALSCGGGGNSIDSGGSKAFLGLSRKQRVFGFMSCTIAGLFCFVLAWIFLLALWRKPRKFVILFTLGSLFTMLSWSLLYGPWNHFKHITSTERLPFTASYFGSLFATLYFAIVMRYTLLTMFFAILQQIALLWYYISYIPGGVLGLKFFTKMCKKAVETQLPM